MVLRAGRRFVEEVRRATALRSYQLAEEAMLWDFREPGALAGWECISDRELGGRSRATLEHNKKGMLQKFMVSVKFIHLRTT